VPSRGHSSMSALRAHLDRDVAAGSRTVASSGGEDRWVWGVVAGQRIRHAKRVQVLPAPPTATAFSAGVDGV